MLRLRIARKAPFIIAESDVALPPLTNFYGKGFLRPKSNGPLLADFTISLSSLCIGPSNNPFDRSKLNYTLVFTEKWGRITQTVQYVD